METLTPALTLRGLAKRYAGAPAPAVDGLDLTIRSGEAFGLLGPNGAGKTTTISIICGLLAADGGRIEAFGSDLAQGGPALRRRIGLVPQELALYPVLTVEENLAYFGRVAGLGGTRLRERIEAALNLADLHEHRHKRVERCSGGLKRRANLAVALVHAPQLLVLDEPTVGVDAQSRAQILAHLRRLRAEGMTLLYTTHYLEEAEALCDRVAIMDHGHLLAEGSPTDLLAAHAGCRGLEDLFLHLTGHAVREAP